MLSFFDVPVMKRLCFVTYPIMHARSSYSCYWSQKKEVDVPSDGDSEADKTKMEAAQKTQAAVIKDFKSKKKEREVQEQLRKQ